MRSFWGAGIEGVVGDNSKEGERVAVQVERMKVNLVQGQGRGQFLTGVQEVWG